MIMEVIKLGITMDWIGILPVLNVTFNNIMFRIRLDLVTVAVCIEMLVKGNVSCLPICSKREIDWGGVGGGREIQ